MFARDDRRGSILRKGESGEALARAAMAYIEAHSAEKFSLRAMAGALFVNGSYLLRTFKRYAGCTPLVYHHRMRCAVAKELLAGSDKSISEIGEIAGFVSSSHFAHVFGKMEGRTPTEYRAESRPSARGEEIV